VRLAALGDPDTRGIRVAILSVTPLTSTTKIRALPDSLRPIQNRDMVFDDPTTWRGRRGPKFAPNDEGRAPALRLTLCTCAPPKP
jgi:hypothetical protein